MNIACVRVHIGSYGISVTPLDLLDDVRRGGEEGEERGDVCVVHGFGGIEAESGHTEGHEVGKVGGLW